MPLDIFNMYYNIIIQENSGVLIFYLIQSEGFCSSNMKNLDSALHLCNIQHFNSEKQNKFRCISGNQQVTYLSLHEISQTLFTVVCQRNLCNRNASCVNLCSVPIKSIQHSDLWIYILLKKFNRIASTWIDTFPLTE